MNKIRLMTLVMMLFLALLPLMTVQAQGPVQLEPPVQKETAPPEVVSLRTEHSKTYQLGPAERRTEFFTGPIHYKDNYADSSETWKDIDLTWRDGRIDRAPYTAQMVGLRLLVTDKRTGETAAIELSKIAGVDASTLPKTFETGYNVLRSTDVASGVDLEIVAGETRLSYTRVIKTPEAQTDAEFSITGDLEVKYRALDATGKSLALTTSKNGSLVGETLTKEGTLVYPLRIDPTTTFYPSGASDGLVYRTTNGDWASMRTGVGDFISSDSNSSGIFIILSAILPQYDSLARGAYFIDTSSLPDGAVVSSATFSVYGSFKRDNLNITPNAALYDTTSVNVALANSDFEASGTTLLSDTVITYAAFNIAGYNDFALNAAGKSEVSTTGWTRFVIRNKQYDADNSAPPSVGNFVASDLWAYYSEEAGTDKDPKLVVTYAVSPTVTTQAATSITTITAIGNGTITDTGGDNATVRGFEWDIDSGAPYANNVNEAGSFGAEAYTLTLTGLPSGTALYYRAYATNTAGTSYGAEETFTTNAIDPGVSLLQDSLSLVVAAGIIVGILGTMASKSPQVGLVAAVVGMMAMAIIQAFLGMI